MRRGLLTLVSTLVACAPADAPSTQQPVVTDSAGVRIVESPAPEEWIWAAELTEVTQIGTSDDPKPVILSSIVGGRILSRRAHRLRRSPTYRRGRTKH